MNHTLQITVDKKKKNRGIVTCRSVSIREKLFRFIFGDKIKLTIIVPGDSVEEIGIKEICERGEKYGRY